MYSINECSIFFLTEFFKNTFKCVFSTNNPQRKAKEEATYIFFMDFLEEFNVEVMSITSHHSNIHIICCL